MVEQRGPGEGSERDPVGSDRAGDPSRGDGERVDPATAGEGSELSDNDRADNDHAGTGADEGPADVETEPGSDSAGTDAAQHGETADAADATHADVVPFPDRAARNTDVDDDSDLDDLDLDDSDEDAEHVDLAALQSDDALLTALGGTDPDVDASESAQRSGPTLEALLVSWRRDVDATPIGELVDVDTAASTIEQAKRPARRRRRHWHLVPVASAAAVLMIAFTGVGLAAKDALPGDMLWGVAKVLYTDHARAAQAANLAQMQLDEASAAWDNGQRQEAAAALSRANDRIQNVDPDHGFSDLRAAHESLSAKFDRHPGSGVDSSTTSSTTEQERPNLPPSSQPSPSMPPEPPSDAPTTSPGTTNPPTETTTSPSDEPSPSPDESTEEGTTWSDPGSGLFPQNETSSR
ncbi:hypothetical protein GIY23_19840 [Allosaccharopolyspora coralli]|uniref:Anti-sigma-D factor RsdA sigma factor binding region domain-containing protein n=1 Tax=Allosaccharopolyspora coralli TaxID=2665642 RepID=A0A5Q3QAF2_9PSEU|nr:anti-sigma-D factor RsdA [Allosaccharopolyspora coralli]QGK71462.1 hypothetical protein GIY23_19840 [Allosaccharopolyspora coralli]